MIAAITFILVTFPKGGLWFYDPLICTSLAIYQNDEQRMLPTGKPLPITREYRIWRDRKLIRIADQVPGQYWLATECGSKQ